MEGRKKVGVGEASADCARFFYNYFVNSRIFRNFARFLKKSSNVETQQHGQTQRQPYYRSNPEAPYGDFRGVHVGVVRFGVVAADE